MRIGPDDPRYHAVVDKQFNKRFKAKPDYVNLVGSADDVIGALQAAIDDGSRVVVTSGGHCLEGFVSDPDVRVIIDVSPMKRIYYDTPMRAVAVEAGATVGETFRALFANWGVVVPLGEYPAIGMGGHVSGGAFGFLCRVLGLAADYLYALEVVTVDASGRAISVVATREMSDQNRDLWWAHTGGGAGNFGIVTRYWFRSPDASGDDPSKLLPRAPQAITTFRAEWNWSDVDRARFLRLLTNHGMWAERNSHPDSANLSLWNLLMVHRAQAGNIIIRGLNTAGGRADRQITEYLAVLGEGVGAAKKEERHTMSWLEFALNPFPDLFGAAPPGGVSTKVKDALLKKRLTDRQIGVVHHYMTRTDYDVMGGAFGFASYGGRINSVATDATASAQRSSIFDMACNAGWMDPDAEAKSLRWVRSFYGELFEDTGGVPAPGAEYEGGFINHPDADLADPTSNKSGVPWYTLYYGQNYPRLQRIKAKYDPQNIFRHALSIRD
jgi:aclacinomycin oxidase